MAEESISLSESEYRLLETLTLEGVQFLIVGLSAALLQGVPAVTQDIDLWIEDLGDEKFLRAISKAGAIYIPPGVSGQNPPMLAGQEFRGIDLVSSCSGLGAIGEEINNAIQVRIRNIEVFILPLERIILSKESAGRDKDKAVLPMLRAALKALKS